jgi:hypothetical protein
MHNYYSENGALFRKKDNCLVHQPKNGAGNFLGNNKKIPIYSISLLSLSQLFNPSFSLDFRPIRLFEGRKKLTSISLPSGIKQIRKKTFNGCSSLISINIPDSVRVIKNVAFSDCISLEELIIPKRVRKISKYAFKGCPKLTIHTVVDSYADQYAKAHNIPCKTYSPKEWEQLQNNQQNKIFESR